MSKRFTDTDKFKKAFYRGLPSSYKLLWDYLYHDCNHAGIWHVDFEIAQIFVGKDAPINREDALKLFNTGEERILVFGNGKKWLIRPFIFFQYGVLNPSVRLHRSIMDILEKEGIKPLPNPLLTPCKGLPNPSLTPKDKDKYISLSLSLEETSNKETNKKKEKSEEEKKQAIENAFKEFWGLYPERNGKKLLKAEAMKLFAKIKDEDISLILQAVRNYANSTGCRNGYAKDAVRFLRNSFWRDWIEPEKTEEEKTKEQKIQELEDFANGTNR